MAAASASNPPVRVEAQDSGVTVRLRGISAVDANIAWASGREGTVLRTLDGGKHWTKVSVPDAKDLDFRDIEAFDAKTAVVLSIGPGAASRVYRTEDGGKHWTLALKNDDERAFFDCMAFDGKQGWMWGDPVDGAFQVRTTLDGGRTWTFDKKLGSGMWKDEAAFAASGTCIAHTRHGAVAVSGGGASRLHDLGSGIVAFVDMPHRVPGGGIFSVAPRGDGLLLVGGDFEHDAQGSAALATFDTLHGWSTDPLPDPRGYRSGAACFGEALCLAVGPTGVDALRGKQWTAVSDTGYDAVDIAGKVGWMSGDKGRIARITLSLLPPQASSSKSPQASPPSKP
ncbi:oxidoreductase [Lysobacter helvus]|uniref:Oxidoreductase n=3 Tax=Lysobacterales TaxID=135614 RepID=A0ABN6FPD2_9GAMM|nr:oxidoreductase [Lysobacter caseinilyticus]BCT94604.1 oxidoreductase [Lysobacter helvus]